MTVDFQRLWTISQDVEMIVYENTQVAVKSFEPQPVVAPTAIIETNQIPES